MSSRLTLKERVKFIYEDRRYSKPDEMLELSAQYTFLPLVVYGTEKIGFSDAGCMMNMPQVGHAFSVTNSYVVYKSKQGQALAFWNPEHPDAAKLSGELFMVTPEVLFALDAHNTNGIFTNRRSQPFLWYHNKDESVKEKKWYSCNAYVYHASAARYHSWMEKGDLQKLQTYTAHHGAHYYAFTHLDDKVNKDLQARRMM